MSGILVCNLQEWFYLLFKTAVLLACCQSRATCPVSYDCRYILQRTGAISLDTALSILVGRRSGPDAFDEFKLLSNFSMPGMVNCISDIGETGMVSSTGRYNIIETICSNCGGLGEQ